MAAAKLQSIDLVEQFHSDSGVRVDRGKNLITGVKVLGARSQNKGREYPPSTQRRAHGLLEGSNVNIDHTSKPGQPAPLASRFAKLQGVRDQNGETYGDLRYNPKHPLAESLLWFAENEPSALGLSINAHGKERRRGGKNIVEEITRLFSVDLVGDPATTKGLFEHREGAMTTTAKALLEAVYAKKPAKLKVLKEDMPADIMAAPMEAPAEDADTDDQVAAAFRTMVIAVLDDDSLDLKGKLGKIKQILTAEEKLTGAADDSSSSANATATEGKTTPTPTGDVRQLREEIEIRDQVEDAGLKFGTPAARKAFVKSLVPLAAAERTALIEERQTAEPADSNGQGAGSRPAPIVRSGTKPLQEAKSGGAAGSGGLTFQDNKSRAQFLRTGRAG
jgi:hypothetical protein